MCRQRSVLVFVLWLLIATFVSGCGKMGNLKTAENQNSSKPPVDTKTAITKDNLRERLKEKKVSFIESPCDDKPTPDSKSDIPEPIIKKTDSLPCDKQPNPLILRIKIISSYRNLFKARLNNNWKEMNFDELTAELKTVFKEREANGVFEDAGSNKIEKRINLAASDADIADYEKNNITVEDFERLVDDLQKEGIDEIRIDFVDYRKLLTAVDSPTKSAVAKTVSLGVINDKAVKLVEPTYPPAAKAVKASGQVMVQVTIDEQGNVISAEATSGHPLLKDAAVRAAQASKFSVTMFGGRPAKATGLIVYKIKPPGEDLPQINF